MSPVLPQFPSLVLPQFPSLVLPQFAFPVLARWIHQFYPLRVLLVDLRQSFLVLRLKLQL